MPAYKFRYFNVRGLGEVSRLLFVLAGQEYEDVRFTSEQWKDEKANTPFGQMPILEIDGKPYCQSTAIFRYLARTFGLYGKDDLDALEIDQALGIGQDIMNTVIKTMFENDKERKAEYQKELEEIKLPQYLGMYEKILGGNCNGHFVGNEITLADVYLYDLCQKLDEWVDLSKYKNISKCREIVGEHPKIKAYVDQRPVTEM